MGKKPGKIMKLIILFMFIQHSLGLKGRVCVEKVFEKSLWAKLNSN